MTTASTKESAESPREKLRENARAVFLAAVGAADPSDAVRYALKGGREGGVVVAGTEVRGTGRLRVLAVGKAGVAMARAAIEVLPREILAGQGIVVVPPGQGTHVEGFEVLEAGHPVPDARGLLAARKVESYLAESRRGDGLLVLLSGGGSALLPAPIPGIELQEKAATTRLLLASGAPIGQINTVRKHLSRLKGGRTAALAAPAAVEAWIVSDVVGDDVSTIASGPTAPDPSTFEDAIEVLRQGSILERVPVSVRRHLEAGCRGEVVETPKPGEPLFARVSNRVIAGNTQSLEAAAARARSLGYHVEVVSRRLAGEARDAATYLLQSAAGKTGEAPPAHPAPRALLAAGETTVTVRGGGLGGRNLELALAFAIQAGQDLPGSRWTFLSAGTDGKDGPTDAAGAIVDGGTLERGRKAGRDPQRDLQENDSYRFFEAAGDLLKTGPTGTNVADIQVFLTSS